MGQESRHGGSRGKGEMGVIVKLDEDEEVEVEKEIEEVDG